jgi:hypothetical protein
MNIVAIAGSTIPSDTANSIQVMKACSALVQLGHNSRSSCQIIIGHNS